MLMFETFLRIIFSYSHFFSYLKLDPPIRYLFHNVGVSVSDEIACNVAFDKRAKNLTFKFHWKKKMFNNFSRDSLFNLALIVRRFFNDVIWPEFQLICLANTERKMWKRLKLRERYSKSNIIIFNSTLDVKMVKKKYCHLMYHPLS